MSATFCTVKIKDMVVPKSKTVTIGDGMVEFLCFSSVEVSWIFNGESLLPSNVELIRIPSNYESRIKITNIKKINEGTYQCLREEEEFVINYDVGILYVHGKG